MMTKRSPLALISLLLLTLLTISCGSLKSKKQDAAEPWGTWTEYWGDPETTDVNYHDIFTVKKDTDGVISVMIQGRDQKLDAVNWDGATLSFTLQTSFANAYTLKLSPDGKMFTGSASNPKGVFPIVWEKANMLTPPKPPID